MTKQETQKQALHRLKLLVNVHNIEFPDAHCTVVRELKLNSKQSAQLVDDYDESCAFD